MVTPWHFKDRTPYICPAGIPSGDPNIRLADCLRYYPLQDQVDALKHEAGIWDERPEFRKEPECNTNFRHQGLKTEASDLLNPPVKTDFEIVINDLKETAYDSYWNHPVGKCRDPTAGLPAGMDPLAVTFGIASDKGISIKELLNPDKSYLQVLDESEAGHELYVKTHNDYFPGEQVRRNYLRPAYDPDQTYGEHTTYDPRGIWVRCCMKWLEYDPICVGSQIQADFYERTRPKLGKVLEPNKNIKCVPEDFVFGDPSLRPYYGVEELMKESPPSEFRVKVRDWMMHLNQLRTALRKRYAPAFNYKEFYAKMKYYDKDKTGWIPYEVLQKICRCYRLNYDKGLLEPLMHMLNILREDFINYGAFCELMDWKCRMPQFPQIKDIPPENLHYLTSSQAACLDYLKMDNSGCKPAGVPSVRFDLERPIVPFGGCRADLENLGDETESSATINPSVYTNYGLNHRDFYRPRTRDEICYIFRACGETFTDEEFERLWQQAVAIDHTEGGLVCVETFKRLLFGEAPHVDNHAKYCLKL